MIYVQARTTYILHVYLNHIQLASNKSLWKFNEHQETKAKKTINEYVHDAHNSQSTHKYQRRKTNVSTKQTRSTKPFPEVITQSLISVYCKSILSTNDIEHLAELCSDQRSIAFLVYVRKKYYENERITINESEHN